MRVIYFIDDKMGGIASLNDNLIRNKNADEQTVILIDKKESTYTHNTIQFKAGEVIHFRYSDEENFYRVIKRLRKLVPDQEGAIIMNDIVEMQMLDHFPVKFTTYQLVHDEYNFQLALRYAHIVDIFIAHSHHFYEQLLAALPQRKEQLFYLPHGVAVPVQYRQPSAEKQPVKLLFLGRMNSKKGIFDLPVIAGWLQQWNIPYQFTCIGNGPELPALKDAWKNDPHVGFLSPDSNEEVIKLCAAHDIYVLPTKFEGSPVALLETMSTGLVPVVTDLPGGIREIVTEDIGFRITEGDNRGFAEKIALLSNDRERLNRLSMNARNKIIEQFDVKKTSAAYHHLFDGYARFFKTKQLQKRKIGSRLDQPFMPSYVTSLLRKTIKK